MTTFLPGMAPGMNTVQPTETRGVSSLLQGTKTAILPENNERMARRRLRVLTNEHEHTKGHGNGCCGGGNHHVPDEELVPLHTLNGE